MRDRQSVGSLETLLDRVQDVGGKSATVSVGEIYRLLGRRSFGPLLLMPALVALTPLGALPSLPTLLAGLVLLIAGQLAVGRTHLWLPKRLLGLAVTRARFTRAIALLRRPARIVDMVLRPRLTALTEEPLVQVIAGLCVLLALTVPPLELLPFADTPSWVAIAAFGLALTFHDGLIAAAALLLTVASLALLGGSLM